MNDNSSAGIKNDLIRTLCSWVLDRPAFALLGIIFKIFFNVATVEIFSNSTIKNFYNRVQLIIGVFMLFFLALKFLQGIMNPDKFVDKQSGFGSVITRIIIALVMLVALVPINIPNAQTEYEIELNNNGLLFGTLYSLQNRLLSNNTLGRLILGTNDSGVTDSVSQGEKLQQSTNIFTSTILKAFVRINLKEKIIREADGKDPEMFNENRMCEDIDDEILDVYTKVDASPSEILDIINISCTQANSGGLIAWAKDKWTRLWGDDRYVFAYIPILPMITALAFSFIILGFIIDIVVRSVKLAVLRLIAPIPIISYVDPKSSKDGAFASWVKALTSTYADLFIRLALIYFVLFLMMDMITNGIIINNGSGIVGALSWVFIFLGLFFFLRMAPKFIKDILGLKGNMTNIGLSAMLGGTAALIGGAGVKGALAASMNAADTQTMAYNQGKQAPGGWSTGRDLAAQIHTGDPKAKGGFLNNINDRLMRDAGINSAWRRYGVTAAGVKESKNRYLTLESNAAEAQDYYNRLMQGHLTAEEMNNLAANGGITTDANGNRIVTDQARQQAYERMANLQSEASKAKSDYEKVSKFADSHRVNPSFEEEHRRSLIERRPGASNRINRPDMWNDRGRAYTAHQRGLDRILGAHNDWDDLNTPRTDNRWSPYNPRTNVDTNAIHDEPATNINTPGRGNGPGGMGGGPV